MGNKKNMSFCKRNTVLCVVILMIVQIMSVSLSKNNLEKSGGDPKFPYCRVDGVRTPKGGPCAVSQQDCETNCQGRFINGPTDEQMPDFPFCRAHGSRAPMVECHSDPLNCFQKCEGRFINDKNDAMTPDFPFCKVDKMRSPDMNCNVDPSECKKCKREFIQGEPQM